MHYSFHLGSSKRTSGDYFWELSESYRNPRRRRARRMTRNSPPRDTGSSNISRGVPQADQLQSGRSLTTKDQRLLILQKWQRSYGHIGQPSSLDGMPTCDFCNSGSAKP